ncbi:MAG: hypothetical protein HQ539_01185 [Parcubacteria group bacterium]|nr:hypothetical protein [Parcubacteria group bacterium]
MSEKYNYKNICVGVLSQLPQKQKNVLERRFGLVGSKTETLQKIGDDFGVTRERVRQIEAEAFSKLRKQEEISELSNVFTHFVKHLGELGGLKREDILLADLGGEDFQNHVLFLFTLGNDFHRVGEDNTVYSFWTTEQDIPSEVKTSVDGLVKRFNKAKQPLQISEVSSKEPKKNKFLLRVFEIAKDIEQGPLGNIGLVSWPEIKPRGVRDAAFLCLKKEGKPLHFRDIAVLSGKLNGEFFSKKKVLPQTAHNELIRDDRFILVGRGVYALKDWGYKEGTVRDVIKQVLSKAKQPMKKEEVVKLVLAQRMVKPNTILLNLNSQAEFCKGNDGRYTIKV